VKVESHGIAINPVIDAASLAMQRQQQIMIQQGVIVRVPQNQQDMTRRINVTEQIRLVLNDADKLERPKLVEMLVRVIDAARDSGLQFDQPSMNYNGVYSTASPQTASPLISCKVPDSVAVRKQVYKAALEDARQKAAVLAALAGMKVGKVIAFRELDGASEPSQPMPSQNVSNPDGLSSALIGELSVNVRLAVDFEMVQ
jgi:hypothetical protein